MMTMPEQIKRTYTGFSKIETWTHNDALTVIHIRTNKGEHHRWELINEVWLPWFEKIFVSP